MSTERQLAFRWTDHDLRHKLEDAKKEVESKGEFGCKNRPANDGEKDARGFVVGTRVHAGDRGNIGTIMSDNGATCTVHFVSPDGQQADKELHKSQLGPLNGTDESVILPSPEPVTALIEKYPELRPPVVRNLLRRTETMNLVAAPKTGKSWLVAALAVRVASGQTWLGTFPCEQGRVLVIDGELHPETIAHRLPIVAKHMNLPDDCFDRIDVWPLRGVGADLMSLGEKLRDLEVRQYDLVILDAWYRFLPPGTNENDNAGVMALYNLIDQYADHLEAAWVNVHHASKGDQSGKSTTDVGSGAGSQSRAADTRLTIRPHEEDGVSVVTGVVRSWPPIEDFAIRLFFPVWKREEDVDPNRLYRPQTANEQKQQKRDEDGLAQIMAQLDGTETWRSHRNLRDSVGMGSDRFKRLLRILESQGRIVQREVFGEQGGRRYEYSLPT